jgi:hypothetical protein
MNKYSIHAYLVPKIIDDYEQDSDSDYSDDEIEPHKSVELLEQTNQLAINLIEKIE